MISLSRIQTHADDARPTSRLNVIDEPLQKLPRIGVKLSRPPYVFK